MKCKILALSVLLAGSSVASMAQTTIQKGSDNIFVGVGVGAMSIINDGINTPTFNMNISVGKYLTPSWGVRAQIGGAWQTLSKVQYTNYTESNKLFGEINLDGMLNVTNLIGGFNPKRVVDFSIFAGPTMNVASAVSGSIELTGSSNINVGTAGNVSTTDGNITIKDYNFTSHGVKARAGATVGFDLGFNCNRKVAINLEGRYGVTPSIFSQASDCRKAESTCRLAAGVIYTFGGKKFDKCPVVDTDALNAEINKYRSQLSKAQSDLADCKNALANQKPVVKEVVKEINAESAFIVFFDLGRAQLNDYGKATIKVAAKAIKAGDKKYKVSGFCDKATGTPSYNQKLSEKRAQVVYDALLEAGVSADKLEKVANGGTENMFGSNKLNRAVIVE